MLGGFHDLTNAYRSGPGSHDLAVAVWTASDGRELGRAWYFPLGLPSAQVEDIGLSAVASADRGGAVGLTVRSRRFHCVSPST